MERSIEKCRKDACIQPLMQHFDKLKRSESFKKDLTFYLGNDWESITPPAAVNEYVAHLHALEKVC